jgi:alpha-L-fucosidase
MRNAALRPQYTGRLVRNGNFLPATSDNARLQEYRRYKKGALVCFGMDTFAGEYFTLVTSAQQVPYQVTEGLNYDTDAWADSLAEAGAKYAMLTVSSEFTWLLWDSIIEWPVATKNIPNLKYGTFSSPTFRKYSVNNWGKVNRNLFYQFCASMRRRGILPVPYIDISDSMNFIGGNITYVGEDVVNTWTNYLCLIVQELIVKFHLRHVWFDNYSNIGNDRIQLLYNAAKSVNPDCLVTATQNSGGFAAGFPCDIATVEQIALTDPATQLAAIRSINGVDYPVKVEVTTTVCKHEQYYVAPNNKPHPSIWDPQIQYRDQSELQTSYTSWQAYNANYNLGICPKPDGTIETAQTDLIKNIV